MDRPSDFYVVAKEPGAEHTALPTWANETANAVALGQDGASEVARVEVPQVPGAFQLLDLLSVEECRRFIELTESLGYLPDAAVSLPRSVRHNHNVVWVVDEQTHDTLWQRCRDSPRTGSRFFSAYPENGSSAT